MPKSKEYKVKVHCEGCGRFIRSQIPVDSPEKLLCSFCIEDKQKAKAKEKEAKRHFAVHARQCACCGKIAILIRYTKLCKDCYFQAKYPHAIVTEVKE